MGARVVVIRAISSTTAIRDSHAYLAEQVEHARGLLIVTITNSDTINIQAFGEIAPTEEAFAALLIQQGALRRCGHE